MKSHDAKRLLEVLRPGEADHGDRHFADALQQAGSDPELARWLADQKQFDGTFARALKDLPVPADLRSAILADRPQPPQKILKPAFGRWLKPRWRIPAAAAAAALIISASIAAVHWNRPVGFAEFCHELLKEALSNDAHLDFKSGDLARIRQWLHGQGVAADVALPAGLQGMRVQGCQVVQAGGQRVPMLCLMGESKHLHLFVVEGVQLAGLPRAGSPAFERYGSWKTAAWQQGDKTYVLSGLKSYTFVNKFRKAGRWTLWG
jgi:hypothetical protein